MLFQKVFFCLHNLFQTFAKKVLSMYFSFQKTESSAEKEVPPTPILKCDPKKLQEWVADEIVKLFITSHPEGFLSELNVKEIVQYPMHSGGGRFTPNQSLFK